MFAIQYTKVALGIDQEDKRNSCGIVSLTNTKFSHTVITIFGRNLFWLEQRFPTHTSLSNFGNFHVL